jgi:hypothetical protein
MFEGMKVESWCEKHSLNQSFTRSGIQQKENPEDEAIRV